MEALIKFRMLHDALNEKEQQLFFTRMINTFGMHFIVTTIFNHFAQSILQYKSYKAHQIQTINTLLSDIIHARKPNNINIEYDDTNKTSEDTHETPRHLQLKLDDLAPPLISNISLYLKQNDYRYFIRINRKIFIGCNSPFSLQQIVIPKVHHQIIAKRKLKHIVSLETTTAYFNEWINPICNASYFDNIKYLTLNGAFLVDINGFLTQNCIDLSNIEHLTLKNFEGYVADPILMIHHPMDTQLFLQFLSQFPNIKYLETGDLMVLDEDYDENNIPFFPKLKRLNLCHQEPETAEQFIKALIDRHSLQIEALRCDNFDPIYDLIKPLPNLKTLVTFDTNGTFWNIVKHTKQLKALIFDDIEFMEQKDIESSVTKILVEQPHLQLLEFWGLTPLNSIKLLSGIEKGLRPLKTLKKKRFNIKLGFCDPTEDFEEINEFDHDGFIELIMRITTQLNGYNIDNCTFNCNLYSSHMENGKIKEKLQNLAFFFSSTK